MLNDGGDDAGILDASHHPEFATALGAGLDVDSEDPLQALHPSHGSERFENDVGRAVAERLLERVDERI